MVGVDNRVLVMNATGSTLHSPMKGSTKVWDDSGTALSVGSEHSAAGSPLFVLDDTVDNVGIAMQPLAEGEVVVRDGEPLRVRTAVPARHKIALVDIEPGNGVRKLGQTI